MPLLLSTAPTPPYHLGKYLLNISAQTQRDRSCSLSSMLVKYLFSYYYNTTLHNYSTLFDFNYHVTETDQIFEATV